MPLVGETFRASPEGREWKGLVRIEARTGRENSGLRERRDNGSNELTRTPKPRSSLSSHFCLSHRYLSSRLFPSLPIVAPSPSAPLNESPSTPSSRPLFTASLPTLSLLRPLPPTLFHRRRRLSTAIFVVRSLFPSCSLQGRFRGSQLPGASILSTKNKDGKSDYYENKST